jgi:hypothetical protein
MSAAQTSPAPAAATDTATDTGIDRGALLRWIGGGGAAAALLTVVAIAVWPASAADEARTDGERLGEAVGALHDADTSAEVDAALTDINTAVTETRTHAGDAVADQAADQADALSRAADGAVGAATTDDEWEAELYQAELDYAVDDLSDQASDFRAAGPEVNEAFWAGVEAGLPSS